MGSSIYNFKEDADKNIFIKASAGTGKTYTIQNIAADMISEGVAINEIAIITFTEKAAAELKDRIRKELEDRQNSATNETITTLLKKASDAIRESHIGTIHSFCRSIISNYSHKIGLSASFTETRDMEKLHSDVFRKFWGKLEVDSAEDLKPFLRKLGFARFKEFILKTSSTTEGKPVSLLHKPDLETITKNIQSLKSILNETSISKLTAKELKNTLLNFKTSSPETEKELFLGSFFTKAGDPAKKVQNYFLENCAMSEDSYKELLNSTASEIEYAENFPTLNFLLEKSSAFNEALNLYKKESDILPVSDLIHKTVELLEIEEVKNSIRKTLKYLILDEAQDTDPLQLYLIGLLFSGDRKGFIFVGDLKQSIYGFRNANVENFIDTWKKIPNTETKEITVSYRSSYLLTNGFNRIFSGLRNLDYTPIQSDRKKGEIEKIKPPILFTGLDEKNFPLNKSEDGIDYNSPTINYESGESILKAIHHIVGNPDYLILDKKETDEGLKKRQIRYSDIAVLAMTKDSLRELLKSCSKYSIPASIYKAEIFYTEDLIFAIANLLHTIENPNNTSALYYALVSDLFLIPEEKLSYLIYESDFNYLEGTTDPDLKPIFKSLKKAHEERYLHDAAFTLKRVLEENRILEKLSIGFEGKRNLTNIYHLCEILATTQISEHLSFGEVVRKLKKDIEEERKQELKLDTDKEDIQLESVQLMTIHASKGLEFPVCALYGITKSGAPTDPIKIIPDRKSLLNKEINIEFKFKADTSYSTPNFNRHLREEQIELTKERERLLYVGITRARDYLILPMHELTKERGAIKTLRSILSESLTPELISDLIEEGIAQNVSGLKDKKSLKSSKNKNNSIPAEEDFNVTEKLKAPARETIYGFSGLKIESYSSIKAKSKIYHSIEAEDSRESEENENFYDESEERKKKKRLYPKKSPGATFGLLCHSIMENYNLSVLSDDKSLKNELKTLLEERYNETGLGSEDPVFSKDSAYEVCLRTLKGSYPADTEGNQYFQIKDWKNVQREKAFYHSVTGKERNYYYGIGDGMFTFEGKYYLLDWKTDQVGSASPDSLLEHVIESYYYQFNIYSLNLLTNLSFSLKEEAEKRKLWENKFGGMLFIFMRIAGEKQGGILVRPSFDELLEFTNQTKS